MMFSPKSKRGLPVSAAIVAAFSVIALQGAFGQSQASPDSSSDVVVMEEFVVATTGSLFPKTEGESFIPLSTYTTARLLDFGATTPVEGLRTLPSFFGDTSTELNSNGGSGAATINLRALGGTLTLVNGRRAWGFADVNTIPIDAIESVDILKDGAGAVYGADALAGVVNFILKKRYEGTQIRAGYGISDKGDAQQWDASVLWGGKSPDGKAYLTMVAAYLDKKTLYARDRELSSNADGRIYGGQNGGSPTFPGHIGGAASGLLLNSDKQFGTSPADYHPFNPATESYNFRELSPSIPGQERKLFHLATGYDFSRKLEIYGEFDYADQFTANGLAPAPFAVPSATARNSRYNPWGMGTWSATTGWSGGGTIPGNTVRYRGTDTGNRLTQYSKKIYRAVVGVQGLFENGWGYDGAYMKSDSKVDLNEKNGIFNSLLVGVVNSGEFNPFARAGTTGTFRGYSWDNHAALLSVQASGLKPFRDQLETIDFKIYGPAFVLPAGAVQIAGGYAERKEHSDYFPDEVYFAGDLLGYNGGTPYDASAKADALFGEVSIPLFSKQNEVFLIKQLSLSTNIRYDNTEVMDNLTGNGRSFGSETHRFGVRYQPTDEVVLRATYGTAFRVPALSQLYAGPGDNFPTLIDPLRFPIGQQTNTSTQGNPDLDPETSVSRGLGIIYSPKKLSGLNVTIDYYKTKLSNLITDGAQFILNQNAATQGAGYPKQVNGLWQFDPNALYANRIFRNPTTGSLDDQSGVAVDSTNLNVSERIAEGIDYSIVYRQPDNSAGVFIHTLEFNQVLTWDLIPELGSPARSYKGKFVDPSSDAIAPGSVPVWKGFYNLLWQKGPWKASFTANYINEVMDDPSAQFLDSNGHYARLDPKTGQIIAWDDVVMERYITYDLTVTYKFNSDSKWLKDTELRFTVINIGDEPPPFSAGAFNDNYDTSLYSNRGRFFGLGITRKL